MSQSRAQDYIIIQNNYFVGRKRIGADALRRFVELGFKVWLRANGQKEIRK